MCVAVIGPLLSFVGSLAAAHAQQQAAKLEAERLEQEARNKLIAANKEALRHKRAGDKAQASAFVRSSVSGADSLSGSPLIADIEREKELKGENVAIIRGGELDAARLRRRKATMLAESKASAANSVFGAGANVVDTVLTRKA